MSQPQVTDQPGIFVGFHAVVHCKSVKYLKISHCHNPTSGILLVPLNLHWNDGGTYFLWNKSGTGFLTSIISTDIPVECFTGTTEIPLE